MTFEDSYNLVQINKKEKSFFMGFTKYKKQKFLYLIRKLLFNRISLIGS
jgi:hypothetical protein